jgi:hypothetical protein
MMEEEMRGLEEKNVRVVVGKHEGRRPFRRPGHR